MAEQGNPRILLLTDELISIYTENRILTDWRDINLKITTKIEPYSNGVYDQDIFGSIFYNRCNCGNIRTPGIRCPRCGSQVLSEIESFKRFARIELPVLYSSKFKLTKLIKLLRDNFVIKTDFKSPYFEGMGWNDPKVLDICQWSYNKDEECLYVTDNITDFRKCSFEGLVDIINREFPDLFEEFRSYLNKYVLVIPMALRAPTYKIEGNTRRLENNSITVIYQNIIYCSIDYYSEVFGTLQTESGKAIFRGSLRRLISSSLSNLSQLMNSSKQNFARSMQRENRLSNSGRCVIVPDPTLKADEVVIPRHLMYESCRDEFIKFISEKRSISENDAEVIYKTQSDLDEVQKLFDEFIEGDGGKTAKHVLITRAPSLHDLSMFACKVRLTHDYVMKIPLVLCEPLNGDFDGDTMAFFDVPKYQNELMNEALSPKNRFFYRKSHVPIYRPKGEMMHGLTLATKVIIPNKLQVFDSLQDAKEYKKLNPEFKFQTVFMLNGKQTTIARETLTELFDKDVNAYLGGLDKTLNAKNMIYLYEQLADKEDKFDRIQKIQEFALNLVTISGSTATKLSDMYLDIDESYLKRIKAVEADSKLDDKAKEIAIRDIYYEYQDHMLTKIPEGLKMIIDETGRAKSTELRDMAVQQLNVGPDKKISLAESTLIQGLNPIDYQRHAIENRGTQDIKVSAVPQSGYVTRQFIYLASEYVFHEGSDETNKGILIKSKDAAGRTTLDGEVVQKNNSEEMIRVRSIITSTQSPGVITADMIPNIFTYKPGARVGMAMISSLTEGLTQAGLGLKHGGNLFVLDPREALSAPEDGTLEVTDTWIIFHGNSKMDYRYPKCRDFVVNYSAGNKYSKGDKLGMNYHPITPSYALDSLIKLCLARQSNSKKKFANNTKYVSECYCVEDGVLRYELEDGNVKVYIGDIEYAYSPNVQYYLPEGTQVKKYQRICSGTLDIKALMTKITDYVDAYYFFRMQYKELLPMADDLIEFLYKLLATEHDDHIEIQSVLKNIHGSESFYKTLAFQDARKSFEKIGYEGMDFISDPLTSVMLSLIVNNDIE